MKNVQADQYHKLKSFSNKNYTNKLVEASQCSQGKLRLRSFLIFLEDSTRVSYFFDQPSISFLQTRFFICTLSVNLAFELQFHLNS